MSEELNRLQLAAELEFENIADRHVVARQKEPVPARRRCAGSGPTVRTDAW